MNSRIEPQTEARPLADDDLARDTAFSGLVQTMSASPLALLIAPRGEPTSQFARAAAIACAAQRNPPADGACGDVVVIFDQWAGNPLAALEDAIAAAVDSATGVLITRPHPDPRTLAELLSHWAERFGANFIIVLDQYERNLAAEPLDARNARFAEQLAEAIAQPEAHARFLVVVATGSEPLLVRLTARLASPCKSIVRLSGVPATTNEAKTRHADSNAAARSAEEPEVPLPGGFSALGDERVDVSATEAILRRRERRKALARWRNAGALLALSIAVAAGVALFLRAQAPDPGARLARALDPQPAPGLPPIPAPAKATPADVDQPADAQVPVPAASAGDSAKTEPAPVAPLPAAQAPAQQPALSPVPVAASPAPVVVAEPAPAASPLTPAPPTVRPETALAPSTTLKRNVEAPTPAAEKRDALPPAFRVDAPPGPPIPAKLVRGVANPEKEPMLFIHIRSESQRGQARNLASGLARLSIVVSGIRVDESGPLRGDLRYYRSGERDEANYLGRALGKLGAPTLRVTQVAGHEAEAVPRHYELWLPPPTR